MGGEIEFLAGASAADVARLIRVREVSAVEAVSACLARIDAFDDVYRAYLTVRREQALEEAARADAALRRGGTVGLLHGVPVNVKDALLMRGTATTVGSVLLRGYVPDEPGDATCVRRLLEAGAIVLGKTNVGSGMSPAYFEHARLAPPRNPWVPECTPGGSSSGSAVSLALAMAYGTVGTDLGGSIRIPAAFTGVVGLKPTYGRVSQYGDVFGMGQALEHAGPLARTVRDAALLLQVLAGHDPDDPTTVERPVPDYLVALDAPFPSMPRIGWAKRGGPIGAEPEVLLRVGEGVRHLASAGCEVEEIDLPAFPEDLWYQITLVDEWEAYDAATAEDRQYLAYIKARLRQGRQKVKEILEAEMARLRAAYTALLARYDLLALPTAPIVARPFDTRLVPWGAGERVVFDLHLVNTWMFNVTGHPSISLPCGFTAEGLPVGLQLVGRHFDEEALLRVSAVFEDTVGGFRLPALPPTGFVGM
jgi:Asp-tRNA(Asn)/Glu-tRNA(Gln) amidotransferase A subunit family amidase